MSLSEDLDLQSIELLGLFFEWEEGSDTIFRLNAAGHLIGFTKFSSPEKAEAAFKKMMALARLQWATSPRQEAPVNA